MKSDDRDNDQFRDKSSEPGETEPPNTNKDLRPGEPHGSTPQDDDDDDEMFILPSNHYPISKSAKRLFKYLAKQKKWFVHAGGIVELRYEPVQQMWQLSPIRPEHAASRFEKLGTLWKHVVAKEKDRPVLKPSICSKASAELLINSQEALALLPPITHLFNAPVIVEGPDGKADELEEGYHHYNRGTFITKGKRPCKPPLSEATASLLKLLRGFRFENRADRARAVAMILTPALVWGGLLGDCHIPLFVVVANLSRAGKGLLLELLAAFYDETIVPLAQRRGGVGSLDEDFAAMLLKGRALISFDNLRDAVDSCYLESFLTARRTFSVRVPHRAQVEIDPRKYILCATSNGLKTTPDLENRIIRINILKRPENYDFKKFKGQDVRDHIEKNQSYYLGCIFSVITHWLESGKKRTTETRHTFREWARVLDWILLNSFKGHNLGRLLDEAAPPSSDGGFLDSFGFAPPERDVQDGDEE